MPQGVFITLEGGEGAGKSTLAQGLTATLERRGIDVRCTREPGGTPLAERLRAVLLERTQETISPVAETALMFAARAVHLDNLVRPALAAGTWVICDRFTDASYAYQGAGRGVARDLLDALAHHVQAGLVPHRTLLLDLPVEDGLRRARQRSVAGDRFEREALPFFAAVRAEYLRRAQAEPERVRVIDATQAPSAVLAAAVGALSDLLPETR